MKLLMLISLLAALCVTHALAPVHQEQSKLQVRNCHPHHFPGSQQN
jgi:hypothetical protein